MMDIMNPNRKRNRSSEEEDFLPLSKKINNLHINNGILNQMGTSNATDWPNLWIAATSQNPGLSSHFHNIAPESEDIHPNGFPVDEQRLQVDYPTFPPSFSDNSCQSESLVEQNWNLTYAPDLSLEENPFYYDNNKLLFELYVARLQRGEGGC